MPAVADIDADGDLDLFVRNCDPRRRRRLWQPGLRNDDAPAASAVRIRLEGDGNCPTATPSARSLARISDRVLVRQLSTVNGAAQSEAVLHFGLRRHPDRRADRLLAGSRTETLTDRPPASTCWSRPGP